MSNAAELLAIEDRFKNQWAAATPIAYENVAFVPPSNAAWVRLSVLQASSQQQTLGASNALHRTVGVIIVSIFTPKNAGGKAAATLADNAAAIFRNKQFSGITCRSPYKQTLGQSGDYHQVNVSVDYYRDDIY